MQPIQLWNVIRNANESVLWTPMWNWNVFSKDALKENYRTSIKETIAPVISGLKIEDFSSNRVSEEL